MFPFALKYDEFYYLQTIMEFVYQAGIIIDIVAPNLQWTKCEYTIILGFWFSRIRSFCFCLNLLISLTTSLSKDLTNPTLVQTLKICSQLQKRQTLCHQMAPSHTKLYWVGESLPWRCTKEERLQKSRQMSNNHPIVQILKMSQLSFPKCCVKYSSLLSSKLTGGTHLNVIVSTK